MSGPRRKPIAAPPLRPCPKCKLGLEAGKNPDGLVWHECRPRPVATRETVERRLLERLLEAADEATDAAQLSVLLRAFAEFTGGGKKGGRRGGNEEGGGADGDELEFLRRSVA